MKPKINIDRKKITAEEIRANKDFSQVLNQFQAAQALQKPFFKKPWVMGMTGGTILIGTILVSLFGNFNTNNVSDGNTTSNSSSLTILGDSTNSPFVNPPTKANIKFSVYNIDPEEDHALKYYTGSQLLVPKNAFVDENGELIKGQIQLKYREFKKTDDFFISGIPMTYDSAGVQYTFESAGMMEITAEQNGKQLFVNPENPIEVNMISEQTEDIYNEYYLDTVERNWQYLGHSDFKTLDEEVAVNQAEPFIEEEPVYLQEASNEEIQLIKSDLKVIQDDIQKIKRKIPERPKAVDKKKPTFRIDVDPKEFPEIMAFNDLYWEVSAENKDFSDAYYAITWDDVEISEKDKGKSYTLKLSKGDRIENLIVYPRYGKSSYGKACENFEEKYEAYLTRLDSRKKDEAKQQQAYNEKKAELEKKRAEWEAEMAERRKKWEEAQANMQKIQITKNRVVRNFTASRFGIFNCDSPQKFPKGEAVIAKVTDKSGNPVMINTLYLASIDRNALFTYGNTQKIKWNPNHENVLWGVTSDNRLAVFRAVDFEEIPSNQSSYTFAMDLSEGELNEESEIKDFLGVRKLKASS
ncbi:MAG: hypothetical protein MRY83_22265 [Flavobacteriales bacterium]|nr:hypothetical protein [Flavobacteriales bacterium]